MIEVGSLVRASEQTRTMFRDYVKNRVGLVLEVDDVWIMILWPDGSRTMRHVSSLEVVSEPG
jgi:hypothetical protein